MAPDGDADAALELSILHVDIKPKSKSNSPSALFPWKKPHSPYAVAWLDPLSKQTTGPLLRSHPIKLYFPLPSALLRSSSSSFTIEILSPSRLPFLSPAKLLGTSVLPLSHVHLSSQTFALPLLRPSGRNGGSVRVAARVLWDLGLRREDEQQPRACPSAPLIDAMVHAGGGGDVSRSEFGQSSDSSPWDLEFRSKEDDSRLCPSAPPIDVIAYTGGGTDAFRSEVAESPGSVWSSEGNAERVSESASVCTEDACVVVGADNAGGGGDKGSVVIGLIGAVAAVVVGVAFHRLKVKPFSLSALNFM